MKKLLLLFLLVPAAALAQLTATVQPGYTFTAGERPTMATLNLLGQPTITIQGTVAGSTGLGAKSVTGDHLTDSVVDGVTLEYNTASPRAMRVKDAGITAAKLAAAVAGDGLTGGAGAPLSVVVDNESVKIGTNRVYVNAVPVTRLTIPAMKLVWGDPISPANVLGIGAGLEVVEGDLTVPTESTFTSAELALPTDGATSATHGLGATPTRVRWVLACKTGELGYSAGDELELFSVRDSGGSGVHFNAGANATTVFIVGINSGNPQVLNKSTGVPAAITPANWKAKCYARP